MRLKIVLLCALFAAVAPAATPELGKDKLRRLAKMPAVSFAPEWAFDPVRGFTLGSEDVDRKRKISSLRRELQQNPAEGEGFLRLGNLSAEAGDGANAYRYLAQAVQLLRKQSDARPDDGLLLAKLGEALQGIGKTQEAESVLRRAVRASPKEWQCWLALGRFLDSESRRAVSGVMAATMAAGPKGAPRGGGAGLGPDSAALVPKRLDEAGACFDQAVASAPTESEGFLRRGLHRTLRDFVLNEIKVASGESKSDFDVLSGGFSAASLADLQQSSRLSPQDYWLIANNVLFEVYGGNARNGQRQIGGDFDFGGLPDATQRSVRSAMTRLEDLGQEPDNSAAAGALEVLGILQGPLLQETNRSVASLRHALALDPSRERAWELLTLTLARTERYDELLSLCEDHLKQTSTPRAHLLLAKAYEKLKQWDYAEQEVLAAVKLAPDDFTANLSLAALLIKRSQDAGTLAQANSVLGHCDQLLPKMPPAQRTRQLVIDFTLTRSICLALGDDVESARKWVKTVLDADGGNEMAREILAAIAY